MMWAPTFFCAFGYWMATNKQMNTNELYPRAFKSDAEFNNHILTFGTFVDAFTEAPAYPLYILFLIFIVYNLFGGPTKWCLKKSIGVEAKKLSRELNEDIPPYFEALDLKDKSWTIKEEENANNALGF